MRAGGVSSGIKVRSDGGRQDRKEEEGREESKREREAGRKGG